MVYKYFCIALEMYCFCLRDDAQQDEEHKTTLERNTVEHKTKAPKVRVRRSLASLGPDRTLMYAEEEVEY